MNSSCPRSHIEYGGSFYNGVPPSQFGPSDDPFYSVIGGAIFGTYIPAGFDNTTSSSGSDPLQAVAVSSGGLTINVIYTSAALSAPQSFRDGIQQERRPRVQGRA